MIEREDVEVMLEDLESLTEDMDIPHHRRTSVVWLEKKLGKFNSEKPGFEQAMEIIVKLREMGVSGY